ncbi:hypothetical protein GF412_01575 [Candidatus Micrarchaeota archaeon]|nr:hypothetical protein [Candidatus Micrarchaeota archaeon]MBD3417657.1 hypothetical protein [Candidatus Micrarchaeota archaeon]
MQKTSCKYCLKERPPKLMHRCEYCGGTFCIGHRNPRNHNCPSLARRKYETLGNEVHEEESRKMSKIYSRVKELREKKAKAKKGDMEEDEEAKGIMAWLMKVLGRR